MQCFLQTSSLIIMVLKMLVTYARVKHLLCLTISDLSCKSDDDAKLMSFYVWYVKRIHVCIDMSDARQTVNTKLFACMLNMSSAFSIYQT